MSVQRRVPRPVEPQVRAHAPPVRSFVRAGLVHVLGTLVHPLGLTVRSESTARHVDTGSPIDAAYETGDVTFDVPLALCRYPYGFAYGGAGWHPFVETLRQYRASRGALRYEDSILHAYYAAFQPATALEVQFGPCSLERDGASELARLDARAVSTCLPWHAKLRTPHGEGGLHRSHGHQGFGPVSEAKGRLEFARLTRTVDSIEQHGFIAGQGGGIGGALVVRGSEYRFVARRGMHRLSALSALGVPTVRVGFMSDAPRIVYAGTEATWPLVRQGVFEASLARRFIDELFASSTWRDRLFVTPAIDPMPPLPVGASPA